MTVDTARPVAMIREARLKEFVDRATPTGHSGQDVKMLVDECRRFRAFLTELADEIEEADWSDSLVGRLRHAAKAVGE